MAKFHALFICLNLLLYRLNAQFHFRLKASLLSGEHPCGCFSVGLCFSQCDPQLRNPLSFPSLSIGIDPRHFSGQASLFSIPALFLCECRKPCLFPSAGLLLLSACCFGKFSLPLLFGCDPRMFCSQSLGFLRSGSRLRLIIGQNGGQPVLHIDLLLIEKLDSLV
ncbi:hypothetical protein PS898_02986 [Pseudomonas fluorescens]|nr:hypothetical protein PS898_02986 [Pseudomonas fluorescens]